MPASRHFSFSCRTARPDSRPRSTRTKSGGYNVTVMPKKGRARTQRRVTRLLTQRPRVVPKIPRIPSEGIGSGVYAGFVHVLKREITRPAGSFAWPLRGLSGTGDRLR